MSRLRPRSPFDVIAVLALFIALGGTSYAAVKIGGEDVRDGSLTGADVKNSSLTSQDLRNRSLLKEDFKAGQLPAGPRGRRGRTGEGRPARLTVRRVTERVLVPVRDIVVKCRPGERATGGSARALGDPDPADDDARASFEPENRPLLGGDGAVPRGWRTHFEVGPDEAWTVTVYAICAS